VGIPTGRRSEFGVASYMPFNYPEPFIYPDPESSVPRRSQVPTEVRCDYCGRYFARARVKNGQCQECWLVGLRNYVTEVLSTHGTYARTRRKDSAKKSKDKAKAKTKVTKPKKVKKPVTAWDKILNPALDD
jgi:hypothetical protein